MEETLQRIYDAANNRYEVEEILDSIPFGENEQALLQNIIDRDIDGIKQSLENGANVFALRKDEDEELEMMTIFNLAVSTNDRYVIGTILNYLKEHNLLLVPDDADSPYSGSGAYLEDESLLNDFRDMIEGRIEFFPMGEIEEEPENPGEEETGGVLTDEAANLLQQVRDRDTSDLKKCYIVMFPNPQDFEIWEPLSPFGGTKLQEYLDEDDDNIVFIRLMGDEYFGIGYPRSRITGEDDLMVECRVQVDAVPNFSQVNFDKWYKKLHTIGFSFSKLMKVFNSQERIFYISSPSVLQNTTVIKNIAYNRGLNIYGNPINITSSSYCGPGTELTVYEDILIADIESLSQDRTPDEILEAFETLSIGDGGTCGKNVSNLPKRKEVRRKRKPDPGTEITELRRSLRIKNKK